jgi:hypothetical protein
VLVVSVIAAGSAWVYNDARSRAARGRPVVAILLGHTVAEPTTWAVLCLAGCVVFIPIYLVARGAP